MKGVEYSMFIKYVEVGSGVRTENTVLTFNATFNLILIIDVIRIV